MLQVTQGTVLDFLAGAAPRRRRHPAQPPVGHAPPVPPRRDGRPLRHCPPPARPEGPVRAAWKDGLPAEEPDLGGTLGEATYPDRVERSPRLVKVLRLESYDDAVHNLAATAHQPEDALPTLVTRRTQAVKGLVGEAAYRLRHLFSLDEAGATTTLGVGGPLAHPFALTLDTLTEQGVEPRPIDLVETTVMLLGSASTAWSGTRTRVAPFALHARQPDGARGCRLPGLAGARAPGRGGRPPSPVPPRRYRGGHPAPRQRRLRRAGGGLYRPAPGTGVERGPGVDAVSNQTDEIALYLRKLLRRRCTGCFAPETSGAKPYMRAAVRACFRAPSAFPSPSRVRD